MLLVLQILGCSLRRDLLSVWCLAGVLRFRRFEELRPSGQQKDRPRGL